MESAPQFCSAQLPGTGLKLRLCSCACHPAPPKPLARCRLAIRVHFFSRGCAQGAALCCTQKIRLTNQECPAGNLVVYFTTIFAATRSFCSADSLQRRSLVPLLNSLRFTRAQSAVTGKLRRVSTIRYTLQQQQYTPRALWLNSEVPSPAQSPRQTLRAAVRVMGRVAYAAVRALLSVHF